MPDAPKLKPCPFCGDDPYTRTIQDEDLSTHNIVDWHFVGCMNCDVSFGIPDGYDCGTAAQQWNTRADIHAELVKAADELADAMDWFMDHVEYHYGVACQFPQDALTAYKQAKEKLNG
jgi:Lar family restriction alleviation protein